MKIGEVITWERTFTEEDIRLFNRVSGDEGVHHVKPDEQGRLMVHGLLTATGAFRVSYRTTGCMLLSCCVKRIKKANLDLGTWKLGDESAKYATLRTSWKSRW